MPTSSLIITFVIYKLVAVCVGIQILNIWVPHQKCLGEDALMVCNYTLDDDKLYSAKWYKDEREFYRYKPDELSPKKIFPLPGVVVDVENSDDRFLYLTNLSMESRGHYRCEVSAEYPSYQTVSAKGLMSICILPQLAPKIDGGKDLYHLGDVVDVTCTSDKSRPASTLVWFINEREAEPDFVLDHKVTAATNGAFVSSSRLKFHIRRDHFVNNKLTIKCKSNVTTMYWKTQQNFTVIDNLKEHIPSDKESSSPVQQFISSPGGSIALGLNLPGIFVFGIWLCILLI